MTIYAYATQDAVTGEWIVGLTGDEVQHEVLLPTTFDSMDETLTALGVRRIEYGWEPWSRGLRCAVEFLN